MNKLLSSLEKSQLEVVIDQKKLKYFMSRVPIWEQTYKPFLVEEKISLLNKYYLELYQKCFGSGNFFLLAFLSCLPICCFSFLFAFYNDLFLCFFFKYFLGCVNGAAGTAIDDFKSNVIACSRKISLTKNIASSEHNKQGGTLKIPNNGEDITPYRCW